MIEKDKVGGTCLHRGCIPAKELLETAATFRHVAGRQGVRRRCAGSRRSTSLSARPASRRSSTALEGPAGLLKSRKITTFVEGTGALRRRPHRHASTGDDGATTELTADHVILAAGSVPRTIPGFDVDGTIVVTSDELLLDSTTLPSSAVVIGGGAIGCEFASMMADLGTKVTILEALPKILPGCDDDVANVVVRSFKKRGIEIRTGVKVTGHEPQPDGGTLVQFGDGEPVEADLVVVSVGRRAFADRSGSTGTGVEVDERGFVQVDEWCRTGEPGVYAVGDLIATPQLAHVGFAEAIWS